MTGWDLPTVSCIAARCSALAAAGGINLPTPGPQIGRSRSEARQPISAAGQQNSARACHPGLVGWLQEGIAACSRGYCIQHRPVPYMHSRQ
jgi:hypothetical protein